MVCFHNPRAVANSQNETFRTLNKHVFANLTHVETKRSIWGPEKMPKAAAGHDTLVLRTKTLLASMAHERTDRTSRRAEIPPPEESIKGGG